MAMLVSLLVSLLLAWQRILHPYKATGGLNFSDSLSSMLPYCYTLQAVLTLWLCRAKDSEVLEEIIELEFDLLANKFLSISAVTSNAFNTSGIDFKEIALALVELVDLKGIHLSEVCLSWL